MLRVICLITSLVAAVAASSQHHDEPDFAALLKRQAPGTPSYNCHDNCGQAITLSRRPDPCNSDAFKTNYNNCLQCAGPDNYNIWRMYGNTLSTTGSGCGLSTTPLSGKQPDVGPAMQANTSGSASAPATPASNVSTRLSASGSAASQVTSVAVTQTSTGVSAVGSSVAASSRNVSASATATSPPQQSTNAGSWLKTEPIAVFCGLFVGAWCII